MKVLDAEFVKGFIRMATDGWEQGWLPFVIHTLLPIVP